MLTNTKSKKKLTINKYNIEESYNDNIPEFIDNNYPDPRVVDDENFKTKSKSKILNF